MKSSFKRLGDFIHLVDERNADLEVDNLLGINITKNYMPTVANTTDLDLSKYKIVRKGRFACNVMHVGRDESLPVSLFTKDEPAIVSPAYVTFEINDTKALLPEYLMIIFQRPEFDRFTWFISDSSIRGGLEWERFCEILIPIPVDIEEQRNYVHLYNGLLKNQHCYERSVEDLQFICDSYMETLALKEGTKVLGDYIRQSDERNEKLKVTNLLGVSVDKNFFPSNTKQDDLDISTYKIVRKRQFGYVTVTSRNGEKLSIALLEQADGIVSSTYIVFDVVDKNILMPEFLFLWFKRKEFDRYARFHSWGSARETFDWADMCEVKIPIPDVEVQKSIVAIHHTLETRKRINERLKSVITPLCPILIKGVVDSINPKSK